MTAVADKDVQTGTAGTVIYGLAPGRVRVNETVDTLFQRLRLGAAFAKLTRPDGSAVWIQGKAVQVARQPLPGEYAAGVNSVIFAGAFTQAVRESLDQVKQAIDGAGGSL